MSQSQQPPQQGQSQGQVAKYYVEFLQQRNNIQNLEKQIGVNEEQMINTLFQEIDMRGNTIKSLQEQNQRDASTIQNLREQVKKLEDEKLPGRQATEAEIAKGDTQPTEQK